MFLISLLMSIIFADYVSPLKNEVENEKFSARLASYICKSKRQWAPIIFWFWISELLYILIDIAFIYVIDSYLDGILCEKGFKIFSLFGSDYNSQTDVLTKKFPHFAHVSIILYYVQNIFNSSFMIHFEV